MRTFSFLTTLAVSLFSLSSFAFTGLKSVVLVDGRIINFKSDVQSLSLNQGQIDYLELQNGEIIDSTDIRNLVPQNKLESQSSRSRIGVDGGGM
ncbi:MAG: hypothetical protein WDA09_08740 [Bacteriovoracaceae bacterium]